MNGYINGKAKRVFKSRRLEEGVTLEALGHMARSEGVYGHNETERFVHTTLERLRQFHEDQKLLKDYSAERKLNAPLHSGFTLQGLINSHRRVVEQNQEYAQAERTEWQAGNERGYKFGLEQVLQGDYIKVEDLRKMTFNELVKRLGLEED